MTLWVVTFVWDKFKLIFCSCQIAPTGIRLVLCICVQGSETATIQKPETTNPLKKDGSNAAVSDWFQMCSDIKKYFTWIHVLYRLQWTLKCHTDLIIHINPARVTTFNLVEISIVLAKIRIKCIRWKTMCLRTCFEQTMMKQRFSSWNSYVNTLSTGVRYIRTSISA